MIGNAPHSPITGVPGWQSPDEQTLLVELAQAVPNDGVIVEIGSEYGMSASLLLHGSEENVSVYCVDIFPEGLLLKFRQNLGLQEYEHLKTARPYECQGNSAEWGEMWNEKGMGEIDLLFIDGDHSYEGVKADIEAWLPHIKRGGHVVFHDCACITNKLPHALHYEVTRAVNEWYWNSVGWQLMQMVDTITVFRKV